MEPGTRVFDTEDDDPNAAIVVRVPDDETIADWTYEKDGEEVSTADENPDYPDDTQLLTVTFEEHLEESWPEWTDAAPNDIWDEVQEQEIPVYGFPEDRLGYVEPPATLESVIAQIAEAVDGTVSGERIYADRLEEMVADQTKESTYKYQT